MIIGCSCSLFETSVVFIVCTFENKSSRLEPIPNYGSISNDDLGAYVLPARVRRDPLCGWYQFENADDFDWIRKKGASPETDTGPSGDKTTGSGTVKLINFPKYIF